MTMTNKMNVHHRYTRLNILVWFILLAISTGCQPNHEEEATKHCPTTRALQDVDAADLSYTFGLMMEKIPSYDPHKHEHPSFQSTRTVVNVDDSSKAMSNMHTIQQSAAAAAAATENQEKIVSIQTKRRRGKQLLLLPDMSTSGGLIFFLHIPKTGGTTIRLNVQQHVPNVKYIFAKNYSTYEENLHFVEDMMKSDNDTFFDGTISPSLLSSKSNNGATATTTTTTTQAAQRRILFFEIHASDSPSLYRIRNKLRRWKETLHQKHIPTFFFTLVREPIAYSFSHFNFFHVQYRNPTFQQCNATEENYLRLSLYNPQCQFLFQGEAGMRAQITKQLQISEEECELVRDVVFDVMDWVGITENLSNETLPLLSNLLGLPSNFTFKKHRVAKRTGDFFGRSNVSEPVTDAIMERSLMDADLYHSVKQAFTLHMWDVDNLSIKKGEEKNG